MREGTAFRLSNPGGELDDHIKVVISDPDRDPDHIVVVSITSYSDKKDQSCVIQPEDFPGVVKKPSCVRYNVPGFARLSPYRNLVIRGTIREVGQASSTLLDRIRRGAAISPHLPGEAKAVLEAQGLLPAASTRPAIMPKGQR